MDELIEPEILENVNRLQVMGEDSAWGFAREEAREPFDSHLRHVQNAVYRGLSLWAGDPERAYLFGDGSGFNFGDDHGCCACDLRISHEHINDTQNHRRIHRAIPRG